MSVSRFGGHTQALWLRRLMTFLGVFIFIGTSTLMLSPVASAAPAEPVGQVDHCKMDWNPLKFIVCPVVEGMYLMVQGLDESINALMTVNTSPIFNTSTDTGEAYYQVWNSMRLLALGIVIIAALVIIISTAFGLEFLDAYTIKKALPRALLAILLITLSWPILEFLITLMNDIGNGVRAIIYFPFRESMEANALTEGSGYVVSLFFSGSMLLLGFFGLFTFGLTAALAILVAFLVLVVREMLIIFLVILAPIGIAMLILPNTQKGWQLWQNTLTTLLVAFPIIAAFIAFGRVFSVVAYSTAQDAGGAVRTINEIIAFLAYFIPYFLLPLAFRMAGGVMATIGNIANNNERGMFDRLKKSRQNKVAQNTQGMKEGTRFKGRNVISSGFNKTTSGAALGMKGHFGVGKRGIEARAIQDQASMEGIMKTPGWNGIKENDDALHATVALADKPRSEAIELLSNRSGWNRERALAAVNASEASGVRGRPAAIAAAQQLGATGTGYDNMDDMIDTVARASGGNKSSANGMMGFLNFQNKQRGRHDLAPGATALMGATSNRIDEIREGTPMGQLTSQSSNPKSGLTYTEEAWNSGSLYQIANGKSKALENFTAHYGAKLKSGNTEERKRAAIAFTEMQNMLPSASGSNQRVILKAMENAGIDYNHQGFTVEEQIARTASGLSNQQAGTTTKTFTDPKTRSTVTKDVPNYQQGPLLISNADLRGKARVYDREAMDPNRMQSD